MVKIDKVVVFVSNQNRLTVILSFLQKKFSLVHDDATLFHRSEWDISDDPSTWYCVYRVALALFMALGVTLHFVATFDSLGIKWFIYMTNQGMLVIKRSAKNISHPLHHC